MIAHLADSAEAFKQGCYFAPNGRLRKAQFSLLRFFRTPWGFRHSLLLLHLNQGQLSHSASDHSAVTRLALTQSAPS
jgi:hypothetical protein